MCLNILPEVTKIVSDISGIDFLGLSIGPFWLYQISKVFFLFCLFV